MAASSGAKASSLAVRRLRRDFENFQCAQNPQIAVQPSEDNLLEWHFVLHSLPSETPYHGGAYHGKLIFPAEYPHAPPAIVMITPSGRLETGTRLCLSMTDFHPESWNPAWSVETILVGLVSFFISDVEHGYGAITMPDDKRRQLAVDSSTVNAQNAEFQTLFPELLGASQHDSETRLLTSSVTDQQPMSDNQTCQETNSRQVQPAETLREQAQNEQSTLGGGTPLLSVVHDELVEPNARIGANSGNVENDDEEPQECWICRDTDIPEPLIHPCACRGSMSGVHASCVEQWVRHHRQNAVNDSVPRCSICHQPYAGYETRPGIGRYFGHLCWNFCKLVVRTFVLMMVLLAYFFGAASFKPPVPTWLRASFLTIFGVAALGTTVLLTVSLPPHRQPPQNVFIRRWFFVSDLRKLSLHMADAYIGATMAVVFWIAGFVPWLFAVPVLCAGLVPVMKTLITRHPSLSCMWRFAKSLLAVLMMPMLIPFFVFTMVWMHKHPLDAGIHLVVAVAVLPMGLLCESNVPLLVLWGAHSCLVLIALTERALLKRLRWREGVCWWVAVHFALLASWMLYLFCEFPKGISGLTQDATMFAKECAALWLLLLGCLALSINGTACVRHYQEQFRTWQNRNGSFRLMATPHEDTNANGPVQV